MVEICGRRIKILSRAKSQTVNICDTSNLNGQYEYTVRIFSPFVSKEVLLGKNFSSIQDLVEYLECDHSGKIERGPTILQSGSTTSPDVELVNRHCLVELFKTPKVNSFALFAAEAEALSEDTILRLFEQQKQTSPCRGSRLQYFVGHTGRTTSGANTNRREEHLAIAIWNDYRESGFVLPDETILFPMDYQLPLKSAGDKANAGIGKVDLFCVDAEGEPWIAELKVHSGGKQPVDTPLKALLQALAYCAILEPNMNNLSLESNEKKAKLLHFVRPSRPSLLILAPSEYWDACDQKTKESPWRKPLLALSQRIGLALNIKVLFLRMDNSRNCQLA